MANGFGFDTPTGEQARLRRARRSPFSGPDQQQEEAGFLSGRRDPFSSIEDEMRIGARGREQAPAPQTRERRVSVAEALGYGRRSGYGLTDRERGGRSRPSGGLMSREGRARHPVAASILAGALYGRRAGEVLRRADLQEEEAEGRREQREEMSYDRELRREEAAEQRAERQRRREAMGKPVPSGKWRDPVTGQVHDVKGQPTEADVERMRKHGYVFDPQKQEFRPVHEGEDGGLEKPGAQAPPGVKTPPGMVWVPGKGFQQDPTYARPETPERTRQQVIQNRRNQRLLQGSIAKSRQRLAMLQEPEPDDRSPEAMMTRTLRDQLELEVEQQQENLAEIEAAIGAQEADLSSRLPLPGGMDEAAVRRYLDGLSDEEFETYRLSFGVPGSYRRKRPERPSANP